MQRKQVVWALFLLLFVVGYYGFQNIKEENSPNHSTISTPAFAFFGAGEAQYFEGIALTIRFRDDLTPAQMDTILQLLPREYYADNTNFDGRTLDLYAEFGYGNVEAAIGEFDVFNEKIRNSLNKIHRISPILFVYRPVDNETDGTVFSAWHKRSKAQLEGIVQQLENELPQLTLYQAQDLKALVSDIYALYELDTKDLQKPIWNPTLQLIKQINAGDVSRLSDLFNRLSRKEVDLFLETLSESDKSVDFYSIIKHSDNDILLERLIQYPKLYLQLASSTIEQRDTELKKRLKSTFWTKEASSRSGDLNDILSTLFSEPFSAAQRASIVDLLLFISDNDKEKKAFSYVWQNMVLNLAPFDGKNYAKNKKQLQKITQSILSGDLDADAFDRVLELYIWIDDFDSAYQSLENILKYRLEPPRLKRLLNDLETAKGVFAKLRENSRYPVFFNHFYPRAKALITPPAHTPPETVWTNFDNCWKWESANEERYWNRDGQLIKVVYFAADRIPRDDNIEYHRYLDNDNKAMYIRYYDDGNLQELGSFYEYSYYPIGVKTTFRNPNDNKPLYEANQRTWTIVEHYDKASLLISRQEFDKEGNIIKTQ